MRSEHASEEIEDPMPTAYLVDLRYDGRDSVVLDYMAYVAALGANDGGLVSVAWLPS